MICHKHSEDVDEQGPWVRYLSFELVVDVHEDESWDLHQRDDEGSFGDGAQVIPDQPQDRGQDGGHWEPVLVPKTVH